VIRQRQFEADLAEEMEFHRTMSNGRDFGNATLAREDSRAVWISPWLESIWQDGAYAFRNLRRQPGFTAVVVLLLGIVIGLHTTLLTVLAGVMLRPWPGIKDPARVVTLYLLGPTGQPRPGPSFSVADVRSVTAGAKTLDGVAAMFGEDVRIGPKEAARPAGALLVSGNFFQMLGIDMAHGRGFVADEDRPGDPRPVAILTHDFWQSAFGGDPAIVGRSVRVNDTPFTIVGVVSQAFGNAEPAYGRSVFLPIAALPLLRTSDPSASALLYNADYRRADVVARLGPGATPRQARAELDLLSRDFVAPDGTKPRGSVVTDTAFFSHPGRMNGANGPLMVVALISAGLMLVWLLACANIGNLMLARAAARAREIGIRLSLGASRRRIVRQLLTEGFVLALIAGALGIGIAYELPFAILRVMGGSAASFPFRVTVDGVVLGYAVLLAGLSALAFGLAPALHATRADVARALAEREGLPASRFPLRGVLLGVQVAVSVVLLVSAGLLVRAAQRQSGTFDPGFSVNDVSVVSFELPPGAYDDARRQAFFTDLTAALGALPTGAIDAFGFASQEPSFLRRGFLAFVRRPGETPQQAKSIMYANVSAGYFNVLGIPIVAGRDFEPADATRPVVLINEAMAREYWPNDHPIGKTFVIAGGSNGLIGPNDRSKVLEIVGVIRNNRTNGLYEVSPMFYQPLSGARPVPKLLVRTSGPLPSDDLARIVQRIDPRVRTQTIALSAVLEERMQETRTGPMLAGVLGACALALATVGMFGVFAYAVRQRTREIGIRMALGAQPAAVVRLVLAGHSRAVAGGLVAGLLGGVAVSFVLRSRLHGLSPFDPVSYLGVAAVLAIAGLAASYVPARRATRVDPVVALRHE
jgi:predicted permease